MREVPENLMIEICLRLPVESIGRFKSVSKRWNCFLSTPEFAQSHFQRVPERILLVHRNSRHHPRGSLSFITLNDDHNGGRSRAVKFPLAEDTNNLVLRQGCCNGLVLLSVNSSLVVMNPVTLKHMILPEKYKAKDELMYGLGYNSAEDDYKVVEIAYGENLVKIFSLKTRCCREYSAPDDLLYSAPDLGRTIYVEGRLYWYNPTTRVINAFDLSTEKFEQLPFPTDFYSLGTCSFSFKRLGGCFAIVDGYHMSDGGQINVWTMEKPGDWRKYTISDYPNSNNRVCRTWFYDVVSRLRESEFVLSVNDEKLVAYNCETKVWRTLDIDALPYPLRWGTILTFKESLVGSYDCYKQQLLV